MHRRENISYLVPRDPSIKSWSDRVKLPAPCKKNLIQLGMDEFEETMGDKIKVYLRLKGSESSESLNNPYAVLSSTMLETEAPKESIAYKNVTNGVGKLIHRFTFTSVLDQDIGQAVLFKKCVVKNFKAFLSGENYLLMAYGTTSAGKTYTMQGNVQHPGVIPRALDFLFTALKDNIISNCRYTPYQYNEFLVVSAEQSRKDLMHKNFILSLDLTKYQRYPDVTHMTCHSNSSSGVSDSYENVTFKEMKSNLEEMENSDIGSDEYRYSVWISMIEIYNEQVYDLLDVSKERGLKPKLAIRDDDCGNSFVKNLRYVNVSTGHEAFQIFQFGQSNLHFAPTALNAKSSRSHCIFTITLAKFLDYDSSSHAVVSRFSFGDLAGLERAKKTLNEKDRLVESKAINTSLSILVKCLTVIKENQTSKEKKIIPYRESKLTRLFRDAVLGKEQFSLIVNVTTIPNLFDETLNVLKFSAIAQKIIPQNVFVKPKIVNTVKRSRFSRIVCSHSNITVIDWDVSGNPNTKTREASNVTGSTCQEIEELKYLVESLRTQLEEERKRCENIEADIREQLTSKFSEMLKKYNENTKIRLENETDRIHEMYEKKQRRLVHYYELLNKNNRRPKPDDDMSDCEDNDSRLKEIEKEGELLREENESQKVQLCALLEERQKLLADCSALRFKVVEKERELEALQRVNGADKAGGNELEKELRKQLKEANERIFNLKTLLNEAASDFKEAEGNNKFLSDENKVLEQQLTENLEIVCCLKDENAKLQKMLSQRRIVIEKLEENSILQNEQQEQLKKTSEWLRKECEDARVEKVDLKKELEIANLKVADLETKMLSLRETSNRDAEMERQLEERMAEAERVKALELEKEVLEKKCKDLEAEVKSLQKEVKDLIVASKRESDRLELELLTKENEAYQKELFSLRKRNSELEKEVKLPSDNLKTTERESKVALDSLLVKFEAVQCHNSIMKNLKEAPHLHEEIKRLEKEIENRDKDMESFNENRKVIFNNFEKELTKLKKENERLRKDVLFANEVIAKNMTPLKTDKAEINRLKESVKKKDEEINKLKAEVESFKKPEAEFLRKGEINSVRKPEPSQANLEESSSRENSPFVNPKKKHKEGGGKTKRGENSVEKLTKQVEDLSIQQLEPKSTRKKIDLLEETIHPSTIKNSSKGRKRKENGKKGKEKEKEAGKAIEQEKENIPVKVKGKCYKKLFTDNDFDELIDLNASPLEEVSVRLRPRK